MKARIVHPARLAWIAAGLLAAAAAVADGPRSSEISHETVEQRWESPECAFGVTCARVLHRYPRFAADSPDEEALGAALNAWVEQRLSDTHELEAPAEDPQQAIRRFFADHRARAHAADPEWFDERRIDVLHQDSAVISLRADRFLYEGGAHPLQQRRLASFTRGDATRIALDEVLRAEARPRVAELITEGVRAELRIPQQLALGDLGFVLEDDRLPLTDNFAVTAEGLTFRYDPYDVAPHAVGPVEIELRFEELEGMLREDGIALQR